MTFFLNIKMHAIVSLFKDKAYQRLRKARKRLRNFCKKRKDIHI
jgi:hypothetical protein